MCSDWNRFSGQLQSLLSGAWQEVSKDFLDRLQETIETGDIAAIERISAEVLTLGAEVAESLGDKTTAIITHVHEEAIAAWRAHGMATFDVRSFSAYSNDFQRFVVASIDDQVKRFAEEAPARILHPEILRQLENLRESGLTRVSDTLDLRERLTRISEA